jgi:hypothetical protein
MYICVLKTPNADSRPTARWHLSAATYRVTKTTRQKHSRCNIVASQESGCFINKNAGCLMVHISQQTNRYAANTFLPLPTMKSVAAPPPPNILVANCNDSFHCFITCSHSVPSHRNQSNSNTGYYFKELAIYFWQIDFLNLPNPSGRTRPWGSLDL